MSTATTATSLPKLIVGLGNPGDAYTDTRHNTGFAVVDRVLERLKQPTPWRVQNDAAVAPVAVAGRPIWLAKPRTYMNASGPAVHGLLIAAEARPDELLVVYDCLDLPLGRLRLRPGGGSGGHRGIASIIDALGSNAFPRLRLGIGRQPNMPVVEYVLSGWSEGEKQVIDRAIGAAADAVLLAVQTGVAKAMNRYNRWSAETDISPATPTAEGVA
jgi:PTH1 family peptidyl-tRNA hydrolase